MKKTLLFLAGRAPRTIQNQHTTLSDWRWFCSPPSPSPSSNSKLFVGGLSWSVDEKSLLDAFSSFGEVTEVKILYDKDSGRSRGFGFVSFTKEEDASSAKDAMDGKALLGRPLRITYALEKVRGAPVVVPRLSDGRHPEWINQQRLKDVISPHFIWHGSYVEKIKEGALIVTRKFLFISSNFEAEALEALDRWMNISHGP